MVKSDDIVSIVISDITRPTPNHILVPLLIEEFELMHRDQSKINVLLCLG